MSNGAGSQTRPPNGNRRHGGTGFYLARFMVRSPALLAQPGALSGTGRSR
jgi:hypothetical protein